MKLDFGKERNGTGLNGKGGEEGIKDRRENYFRNNQENMQGISMGKKTEIN